MRRLSLLALASVSLVAMVTVATSSYSASPQTLGTLKQQDKWKVGIVDPQGQAFCAMVSKFDKGTGLAFAMSPEGYGSVALDLTEKAFTAGDEYQAAVRTNGSKAGNYPARATSDRSVVVQVGQSKAFYDALKSNATLGLGLPALDATFALNQFGKNFGSLVECSQTLNKKDATTASGNGQNMPAVKVKEVEQAPLDRELEKLSGTQVADAGDVNDKAASFDDAEATLDKVDTKADAKTADAAKADIDWSSDKPAKAAPQAVSGKTAAAPEPKSGRKLLASATALDVKAPQAADSAATARKLDDEQARISAKTKALEDQKLLVSQKQAEQKAGQDRIAALEADKKQAEAQHLADVAKQKELDEKLAALQKEVADARQARVDSATHNKQVEELQQKLAATQDEYKTKVAAVETERDALKKQLADAVAAQKASSDKIAALQGQIDAAATREASAARESALQKQKLADLEEQLRKSDDEKQGLKDRIAALEKDGKASEAALIERKKDLEASAADSKELRRIKSDLDNIKAERAATVDTLQKQLAEKTQAYDDLSRQIADAGKQGDDAGSATAALAKQRAALSAQMAEKQARVDALQSKLRKLEGERTKALALADQAQTEVKELRKSLVIINDDELPAELKARTKAELLSDKEKAELNDSRFRIALLESQLEASRDPDSANYIPNGAKRLVHPEEKALLSENDRSAPPHVADRDIVARDVDVESLAPVMAPKPTRRPGSAKALLARKQAERSLQSIEPAAGATTAAGKPTISDNWFGGKPVAPAPVISASPVKSAAADKDDADDGSVDSMESPSGGFNENRASAFLDRIMSYHTGGKPVPVKEATPVFGASSAMRPVETKTVAHAKAKVSSVSPSKLAQIETASGDNMADADVPARLKPVVADAPKKPVADAPKKSDSRSGGLLSWLSPAAAPAVPAPQPVVRKELPVENILSRAGVRDATFADAKDTKESKDGLALRQWTTGDGISGMYEQTTATRSFDVNVQKYLDRYRKDCKDLKVKLTQPETSGDVMFSQANISCAMRGNNYSTSLVFAQNDDSFNAILHSGFPSDAAEVKSIGNSVAKALARSYNPLTRDIDTASAITHDPGLEIVVPGKPVASKSAPYAVKTDGDTIAQ